MKRTVMRITLIAVVIASFALVPPLQSFAMDALSVFRVGQVKTLKITVADLKEGMQNIGTLQKDMSKMNWDCDSFVNILNAEKPGRIALHDEKEFNAFSFNLPRVLKESTPKLYSVIPHSIRFTLNTKACNEMLSKLESPSLLPKTLSGVEMSVVMPASIYAEYDDVLFYAAQNPAFNAPQEAKDVLKNIALQIPMIPQNIRQQLSDIDVNTRDIYLPVLLGVGREVDLGGKIGYIYTISDLKGYLEALPADILGSMPINGLDTSSLSSEQISKMGELNENTSVLIWTKGGILYSLAGNKADSELVRIARSVH